MITFQEILRRMSSFWEKQGCIIHQGYDLEVGAGTFNPATFLRSLGPEPYRAAYIEPSRRPADGRYGTNPNRLQHYFQYQVIIKPSPLNLQELYLQSLESIGFNLSEHDIRFVHDDWENPTIGAWGLGWEIWMDGMEVSQFTYFQSVAGIPLKPITGEITYGIERLTMYLQKVNSIFDIKWNDHITYGDIYHRNEVEWSSYNLEKANTTMWLRHFEDYESEANKLITLGLPIPAYDFVMKASHAFNLLDARGVISVTERTGYISRIRDLAKQVAESYIQSRDTQGHPLKDRFAPSSQEKPAVQRVTLSEELLHPSSEKKEDFVLEIGSEELPATFVSIGCQHLAKSLKLLLEKEGISYGKIETYGTPRRLAIYIRDLALAKPAQATEKRGPSIDQAFDDQGNIKAAGQGFFKSIHKENPSLADIRSGIDPSLSIRNIKEMEYLYATITTEQSPTAKILAEQLPNLILNLEFPKTMRWADLDITYARPIHWIVALLGKHVLPFEVGNIQSGRESSGHRQLCPWTFALVKAQDYLPILKEHKVMVDMEERKNHIVHQLDEIEKKIDGKIIAREQVIPQVLNLVEWPQLTYTKFDPSFLKAPKEVLISEMVEHQKYFPVANADGTLMNVFIITANNNPTDQIREGNLRALVPRLKDGVFLYEQGLKGSLDELNEKLKNVTFQKNLGSVYDKVERIKGHAAILQKLLNISTPEKANRAAQLCKADLASEMVFEFPELQGVIGRYYALAQKEDPEVAQAIDEHWMPRGENAPLPSRPTGIIISLADKLDNLIGCFCANLKPSSSSDPYALRRQALGLTKILIKGEYRLPLRETLESCFANFPLAMRKNQDQLIKEIEIFLTNRVKTVFVDYGFSKDVIEAGLSYGFDDIYDAFCKVKALHNFRKHNNSFPLLFEVYKRAKGQINDHAQETFSKALLVEDAEKELDRVLNATQNQFSQALSKHHYDKAYELIAQIQPALATLFEKVKILADDNKIRNNRIALLQRVFALFSQLLDFSKIQ